MYERALSLPDPGERSFFLWGLRQVGKTTLLKQKYPKKEHVWVDLTSGSSYRKYSETPEALRYELENVSPEKQVVIDEIQLVPELLNEIQWLIDNTELKFALCGSNLLRLKDANLLGGRAGMFRLHGLTSKELGGDFNLEKLLNKGYLPPAHSASDFPDFIDGYVGSYLYREIREAVGARNYQSFRTFLKESALRDGSTVSFANIARVSGVSVHTVKGYFEVLEDSLHCRWLGPYRRAAKSGEAQSAKLYFTDVGLVNSLARRGTHISVGSSDFGKAFENWVCHELAAYLDYHTKDSREKHLTYWKSGHEVDFIAGGEVAIEAKSIEKPERKHFTGLRKLKERFPDVEKRVLVCRQPHPSKTDDGITIMPYGDFARELWDKTLLPLGALPF